MATEGFFAQLCMQHGFGSRCKRNNGYLGQGSTFGEYSDESLGAEIVSHWYARPLALSLNVDVLVDIVNKKNKLSIR